MRSKDLEGRVSLTIRLRESGGCDIWIFRGRRTEGGSGGEQVHLLQDRPSSSSCGKRAQFLDVILEGKKRS